MANISKINSLSARYELSGKLMMLLLILLAICTFSQRLQAETSIYVFDPNQSTVVQTGGFAGVHETYPVEGYFQLSVDIDAGLASFEKVDANMLEPSGFLYTENLGVLFNMTELSGTVVDGTAIEFEGKTADGTESDVSLKLTFSKGPAHLTGKTTPPPNSADMFFYDVNAVATKKYAGGTGEPNNPYKIATAEDLMLLGETPEDYGKHFILTDDIDLDPNLPGRKVFDKAVIAPVSGPNSSLFEVIPFTGVLNGDGYTISHLTIAGTSYLGLFGFLGPGARISSLGIEEVDVNGTGGFVGGLLGRNGLGQQFGYIANCYCKGTVSGNDGAVGGLVGFNSGWITMSHSAGTVNGGYEVGGLVGNNRNRIINSNSICLVTGKGAVGGFVGSNGKAELMSGWGEIINCYSAGSVGGVESVAVGGLVGDNPWGEAINCFWDTDTSGQTQSDGGTGKTTVEMQTISTFLEAGWDFVGEAENGTEDIWSICEGTNYPRFVWQIAAGDFVCPDGITIDDFSFFMEHWLDDNCDLSNGYCQGTDLDQSGTVDVNDLEIFFEIWSAEN